MKKLLALLLALCTVASFAACVNESDTDPLDEEAKTIGKEEAVSEDETEPDESVPEGVTAKPKNLKFFNSGVTTVIISGNCEENAVITAEGVGIEPVVVNAKGTSFALQVELGESTFTTVKLTAENKEAGKEKSEMVSVDVEDAQGLQGNLINPVILADRFVLFSEKSLTVLPDGSVSNLQSEAFVESIARKKQAAIESGDTEIIYVLAPSRSKVLEDKLPEDVKETVSEVSLYKQTVKALNDAGVAVIDLSEAFANAKDYPLFYDTHSGWTDYAAYVAYTEIMNYIDDKFPDAAARGMEDFDVNTVEDAILGDLAYDLGLDIDAYTETVYDFVPKFDLNIGKEYAENTQTPPVVEEPEDSSEAEVSGEDVSGEDVSGEDISGEAVSEESEAAEESVVEESVVEESSASPAPEAQGEPEDGAEVEEEEDEFLATFSLIQDVKLTINEKDYRFYTERFADEYYDETEENEFVFCDSKFCFGTNRLEEYLPSALIYRSSITAPIIPMLGERFRNSVFEAADSYNVGVSTAKEYAGTPENRNVDYIIVIVTEEEIEKLY